MRNAPLALALLSFLPLFATTACSNGSDDTTPLKGYLIGGQVHGLWEGAGGVALRLEADGVNTLLTASANGAFSFPKQLETGKSYTVMVAVNPAHHSCAIDRNISGTVEDADVMNVSVACSGPAVEIVPSGAWGWTFDPTQDTQTFAGSIAVQHVTFMISGSSLTGATVSGTVAALGTETAPIALPLGTTTVPIVLTTSNGLSRMYQLLFDRGPSLLDQVMYGKASNTGAYDYFGYSIALSGNTLAVGAPFETSIATGVNGDQARDSIKSAGAVYVFTRAGTTWRQQAYVKASNTGFADLFGYSVALSGDTLAVGAYYEDSAAIGINSNQTDDNASSAGAVYVFVRTGTTWAQQAYVKASNTGADDQFGYSVALSGDTLAVGARYEDSATSGVNGKQGDNSASAAGAVYVLVRSGTMWTQQAYVKASNAGADDQFGYSVTLSGATLVVGACNESSAATGINGNQADNGARYAGAAYVFVRNGTTWTQQAYVKASNSGADDRFGYSVALSGDTLAVGTPNEASAATGINGTQTDNSDGSPGAVYVFVRNGTVWTQQAYVKASNTGLGDQFGYSIALSGDTLAVGTPNEASAATAVNGNQADNSAEHAGAVYVFARSGTTWTQQAYVKASNTGLGDQFGYSVALSGDALAVVAPYEASPATGIDGNQADNNAEAAGAVYVFR